MISDFRGVSGERGRATLVLSQRAGMGRDFGTSQANGVSALQGGWRVDSSRLFARLRRRRLSTQDSPRSAGLLQQPPSASRLWPHLQHLACGQNPSTERDHPRGVAIPAMRRRRQHCRGMPCRRRLPAKRQNLATPLEAIPPRPKQASHGALGVLSAARSTRGSAPTGDPSCRPSPSRLSRCPLSDCRLPTFLANFFRVTAVLVHRPTSRNQAGPRQIPSALGCR